MPFIFLVLYFINVYIIGNLNDSVEISLSTYEYNVLFGSSTAILHYSGSKFRCYLFLLCYYIKQLKIPNEYLLRSSNRQIIQKRMLIVKLKVEEDDDVLDSSNYTKT